MKEAAVEMKEKVPALFQEERQIFLQEKSKKTPEFETDYGIISLLTAFCITELNKK